MRYTIRFAFVASLLACFIVNVPPAFADGVRSQSRGSVSGGNRGSGGGRNAAASTNSNRSAGGNANRNASANTNANRNTNVNNNTNINNNTNVNVNRNVNVEVDAHGGYGGCCYNDYHPLATAAAVTMTAAAIGSIVQAASMPPSCVNTVVNGMTYRQCGSTWYQPQISGSTTQYVVVNPPQ